MRRVDSFGKDPNAGRDWGAGGEGDDRGWDGWMASPTQWTWVWVDSGSWRWTGRPGVLRSMGSQRVRHDWATELNWTEFRNNHKFRIVTKRHYWSHKKKYLNSSTSISVKEKFYLCWALWGFPGSSDSKKSTYIAGRPGFDPCVRKIPWNKKRQLTPVFLPGESCAQRSLVGYSPQVAKSLTRLRD